MTLYLFEAYMSALAIFCFILWIVLKDRDSPSAIILAMDDLDEWHIGLQSALAAGSDVMWQLEALEEIQATGRSDDAGRLLEWMKSVESANEK
jgi:hypothetical protein